MKHDWTRIQCSLCLVVQTPELVDDDHCTGMAILRHHNEVKKKWERACGLVRREDGAIPKEALVHGRYYFGRCRNADVAHWDAVKGVFTHWRQKFHNTFLEDIKCREDEAHFDVFDPYEEIHQDSGILAIPVSDPQPWVSPRRKVCDVCHGEGTVGQADEGTLAPCPFCEEKPRH